MPMKNCKSFGSKLYVYNENNIYYIVIKFVSKYVHLKLQELWLQIICI